jgi:competence protein ComEA
LPTKIPPKHGEKPFEANQPGPRLRNKFLPMGWKQLAADHLAFSRRDRIAIITLLLLIGSVLLLPEFIPAKGPRASRNTDTAWIATLQRIEPDDTQQAARAYKVNDDDNSLAYQYDRPSGKYTWKTRGELFEFDPNTLAREGWQKLGLRDKTIATIQNYLSKGGKFRKPEDLQRVYGLFPDEYKRIAPYIRIQPKEETGNYQKLERKDPHFVTSQKTSAVRYAIIDINVADTTAWIALPGIGNKLATRIVNFRDKLGGFHSISQVGETFGLPDSTFQKIKQYLKLDNPETRKININTATPEELKAHPYIRYQLANPIIAYRELHGPFGNLEQLKKIMVITNEVFDKISPYLFIGGK